MNAYSIYMYTSPEGKRYVGLTKDLVDRHRRHADARNSKCRRFANAIKHHGIKAFTRTIMETDLTLAQANERERFWISLLNTQHPNGYNLTDGGDTAAMSAESRERQAEKLRGVQQTAEHVKARADARRGKKFNPEQRARSSEAKRKLWADPEYRAKMMASRSDPAYKAKISAAQSGEAHRANASRMRKARWNDPDYASRMADAQRSRWNDPEYKARMLKAQAEGRARKRAGLVTS